MRRVRVLESDDTLCHMYALFRLLLSVGEELFVGFVSGLKVEGIGCIGIGIRQIRGDSVRLCRVGGWGSSSIVVMLKMFEIEHGDLRRHGAKDA